MKVAALYDIHGNLPALDAVLEELKEVQPDLIVVGGDIVPGPLPGQTLERLSQAGDQVRFIRGNGDREVVMAFDGRPISRRHLPDVSEKAHEQLRWVAEQLTPAQRDFLAELPAQLALQVEGMGGVLFCHATSRDDEEVFTPISADERLSAMFSNVAQEIVVCGHTHMQFERSVGSIRILNAGSVGMPFADRPGAYWLLLGPAGYEFRCTTYDGEAAALEVGASGYPFAQEFVEQNMLKVPPAAEITKVLERAAIGNQAGSLAPPSP